MIKIIICSVGIIAIVLGLFIFYDVFITLINPDVVFTNSSLVWALFLLSFLLFTGLVLVNNSILNSWLQCKFQKIIACIIFTIYCIALIYILFGNATNARIININTITKSTLVQRIRSSNFIPLRTIIIYMVAFFKKSINHSVIVSNLIGNFLIFMPMGIFIPYFIRKAKPNINFVMIALLVIIETLQLLTDRGIFDIDDIILNFAGYYIIYRIYKLPIIVKLSKKLKIQI